MENIKKILVIEDDELLRDIYRDTLLREGVTVDVAEDGEIGLEKIQAANWDLVFLDIVLPKMSGFDLLKSYKENKPTNVVKKIVFLTNLDKQEELQEIKNLGYEYLIKSQLTPGEFIRKVNSYIGTVAS